MIFQNGNSLKVTLHTNPGPLFTKRADVLPQDFVKSRIREVRVQTFPIALKFHRHMRCRDASQISERYDDYNIQSRGFETSRDFLVKRLTVFLIEAQCYSGLISRLPVVNFNSQAVAKACNVLQIACRCPYLKWGLKFGIIFMYLMPKSFVNAI